MKMYLSLLNLLTFLWLMILAMRSFHRIALGQSYAVNFVIIVLFIFCGAPLLLDEVIGKLPYEGYIGFAMASSDDSTNIVYCIYMFIAPILLIRIGRPVSRYGKFANGMPFFQGSPDSLKGIGFRTKMFLSVLLISPVVIAFFSPDPGQYLIFSDTLRLSEFYQEAQVGVSLACNLSVLAAASLLATSRPLVYGRWPNIKTILTVMPWLLIAAWIHGKRNIVAMEGLLLILAFHCRGVLKGGRAYLLAGMMFLGVLAYSFFFQAYAGRVNTTWYENVRIDYGRDDKIKMTIYAELHPERMKILEYRGQSLLFHLTTFVPRKLWPDKPLPYAQYFTSAVFLIEPQLLGWGMTTSWLEEAIANFSWLGLLIGPWLIGYMCRLGDASQNYFARILTPLMASLMLVVQATAFFPLLLLWLALVFQEKLKFLWTPIRVRKI